MARAHRSVAAVAVLAVAVVALAAVVAGGRGPAKATASAAAVEVGRHIHLDDGRTVELRLLVDPAAGDPQALADALLPGSRGEPLAEGAHELWRRWAREDIPVSVHYNPSWDPPGVDGAGWLQWALDTWNAVPGHSFRFVYAGTTTAAADRAHCQDQPFDGVNSVHFSTDLPDGVLGSTCAIIGRATIDGVRRVVEFDIQMNARIAWNYGAGPPLNTWDFPSTLLHEVGHGLGLGHSEEPGAVMLATLPRGVQARAITPDDAAGLRALYPPADPGPALSTPVGSLPAANPALPYRVPAILVTRE